MTHIDHVLSLTVATGDVLDVRRFRVRERLHEDFHIELEAVAHDCDIDFDRLIGRPACFSLARTTREGTRARSWTGICAQIQLIGLEDEHLSTYRLVVVPTLWLLHKRRNYRVFQHQSDPRIAHQVLRANGIECDYRVDDGDHPGRKYRVQYAETDHDFVSRLLEDAGVTFLFEQQEGATRLVLCDGPQLQRRRGEPVAFFYKSPGGVLTEGAYNVSVQRQIRPGHYTQGDVDYRRRPEFALRASSKVDHAIESGLERFHLNYGSFLFSTEGDGSTPVADSAGAARTDMGRGATQVERRLDAQRNDARTVTFDTTAHDLAPGLTFSLAGHPRFDLNDSVPLMVVGAEFSGRATRDWKHRIEACSCERTYRPALSTPKPQTRGVESATVVGPDDEDIHTDEFARVRVQFHWDREGKRDQTSSCWVPVSQPWGGSSFGALNIPRIGQEVLVDFLGADPDRPVVVGRVFTKTQPVPYALPKYKTVSGIRSRTAERMVMGGAGAAAPSALAPTTSPFPIGKTVSNIALDRTPPLSFDGLEASLNEAAFAAVSPNGDTHRWHGNEMTFEDRANREVFYMQAERNMHKMVRRDALSVIGGSCGTRVGGDDTFNVVGNQAITVDKSREVAVAGFNSLVVQGDIVQSSQTANQYFLTSEMFSSVAKEHDVMSFESLVLRVGNSSIIMKEEFVVIQSPHLFLNPGDDAAQKALDGERPDTPEEDAQKRAEAAAARQQATVDALVDHLNTHSGPPPRTFGDAHWALKTDAAYGKLPVEAGEAEIARAAQEYAEALTPEVYEQRVADWQQRVLARRSP